MIERENLTTFFNRNDCTDFRWIETKRIIVSHWVRMKCMFGCESFGKRVVCPPNLPTVSECKLLFVYPCNLCKTCTGNRMNCENQKWARPSPEGMAVDVFATARAVGFPIEVLKDYDQKMNRYGLLLIE